MQPEGGMESNGTRTLSKNSNKYKKVFVRNGIRIWGKQI